MKTTFTQILFSFIVVFSSIRGAFVYHLGFPSSITYASSALLILGFGAISLLVLIASKLDVALVLLKNMVTLNAIFFTLIIFGSILLALASGEIPSEILSISYLFLIFPTVFVLLRFNNKLLSRIVYVVALITLIGVFYFFNMSLSGQFEMLYEARDILRPGEISVSKLGENFLPFGYSGSHHDTANILVICGMLFLAKFFICNHRIKSLLYIAGYFVILFATILTGSAANFLILLFMSIVSLLCYIQRSQIAMLISFFVFIGLFISITFVITNMDLSELNKLFYIFVKLNPETYDEALFANLDLKSIWDSILSVFFGFGGYMEAPLILTEVAFVSLLSRFGLIPFCILMFIGFSPIYYIALLSINKRRQIQFLQKNRLSNLTRDFITQSRNEVFRVLMMAMPVLTGFLTLAHYGSLFRITSIGLFCVVMAMFLKEYLSVHQEMTIAQSS